MSRSCVASSARRATSSRVDGEKHQDVTAKKDRRQYRGGRQPLPGPLPNERATVVLDLPDGQLNLRHGHDGQVQALDHMPTPPDQLTTGGRPTGLTRFACPILFKNSKRTKYRGLAPEFKGCRMVKGGATGIASPYRTWCSLPLSLRAAGRSRGNRSGPREPAGASRSRVRGSAPPLPRSRLKASRVALWEGFPL